MKGRLNKCNIQLNQSYSSSYGDTDLNYTPIVLGLFKTRFIGRVHIPISRLTAKSKERIILTHMRKMQYPFLYVAETILRSILGIWIDLSVPFGVF